MSIELLSPAGNMDALVAAVQSGADAVYLGTKSLNARAGAANFDRGELCDAVRYCHERGVRVHVTVNIIVKDGEYQSLVETADALAQAGADAAIVQDVGVAAALHRMLPGLSLHASTQMAVHNPQGVRFAREMGFSRVVLAREMSFDDIRACAGLGVELEAFGHGALCVSCSGQCLMSSMIGGRSGNRGRCAQPCRLPYELKGAVTGSGYLLSPKDLMTLEDLPALKAAGVCSLKLEGRLKRPEYVAVMTGIYRKAFDALNAGRACAPDPEDVREALQIFNRGGFTRGYGPGLVDRDLMSHGKPNHMGVPVGRFVRGGSVRLESDVRREDALAVRRGDGQETPVPGFDAAAGESVRLKGIAAEEGTPLWRLVSQAQMDRVRDSLRAERRARPFDAALSARVGENLAIKVVCDGVEAASSGEAVTPARQRGFDPERARAQIAKTGGTPYVLRNCDINADENAFVPASALNELRRTALDALNEERLLHARGCEVRALGLEAAPDPDPRAPEKARLLVQAGDMRLLKAALDEGADGVVYAPEDLTERGLERAAREADGMSFDLSLPMTMAGETLDRLNGWARACGRVNRIIVNNVGHLGLEWPVPLVLGTGLNLASRRALQALWTDAVRAYMPSIELTAGEIAALGGGALREIMVYGRVQLMSLRHCPIRAQLGGRHADCRRCDRVPPGEEMNAHCLVDRTGVSLPLRRQKSSEGCVVRLLADRPLMLLRHVNRLPACAAWHVCLTDEDETLAAAVVRAHRLALNGDAQAALDALPGDMLTTTGHYFRAVE